jgi:hypothetical protein
MQLVEKAACQGVSVGTIGRRSGLGTLESFLLSLVNKRQWKTDRSILLES